LPERRNKDLKDNKDGKDRKARISSFAVLAVLVVLEVLVSRAKLAPMLVQGATAMRRDPTRQAHHLIRTWRFAAALLMALGLAGPAAVSGAEQPQKGPGGVEVHLTEYTVDLPKTLPAGPTTFTIHNDGRKTHSFKIEGPGIDELLSKPVRPKNTGTLQLTLQPGEYKIYCPIGNHSVKGMTMTLKVTAKP
jgi:Cupredoxin-like domain